MIRSLMASTALLAFVATGALAQQQPADQAQTQQPQAQQTQQGQQTQQQGDILAENLVGETIYSGVTEDAESVGDIEDLVLDADGNVTNVVVGVGGFLGIGEKDVAINFEELQFSQDQDGELRIVVAATQEQLEAAPEFEQTDQTRLYGELTEEERGLARVPQQQDEQAQQQATQQPDQQAQQDQQMAQQPDQAQQPEDQAQPDQQMAQQPDQAQQDQQMAQQPDQAQQDQQMAQPDQQAGQQQVTFLESPESGESRASDWIGQQIVTPEDEQIGEIQDLLVDESGMTEAVIVDVSGFIEEEKQVAVPFDAIQVEQQEGQEEPQLVANLGQEELQQAPAFQPEQAMAEGQQPDQPAQQDQQMAQQDQQAGQQQAQPDQQDQQLTAAGEAQERQAARVPSVEQTVSGLSADQLMGANVIGANNEEIGQVNDVIFSQDGQIRAVVVDVGGFLGIGAKEVAIEFDAAQVQRQDGQELALMIPATEQQLEQAPEYQETAEAQQQGGQQGQQPTGQQQPQAQPDQQPAEPQQ